MQFCKWRLGIWTFCFLFLIFIGSILMLDDLFWSLIWRGSVFEETIGLIWRLYAPWIYCCLEGEGLEYPWLISEPTNISGLTRFSAALSLDQYWPPPPLSFERTAFPLSKSLWMLSSLDFLLLIIVINFFSFFFLFYISSAIIFFNFIRSSSFSFSIHCDWLPPG
jgi:hypothetical protein